MMVRELTMEDFDLGELIDIDEFVGRVIDGEIDDADGYGLLCYGNEVHTKEQPPSEIAFYLDTEEVTHVLFYKS